MSPASVLPFVGGIMVGLVTGGLCALLYMAMGSDEQNPDKKKTKTNVKICPRCHQPVR